MIKIKTPREIEEMKRAGALSAKVLRMVGEIVKPGISTLELDQFVERLIRMHGGIPAFKGYMGFPASICASVNEQVVHGIPSRSAILKEGDIISIDTGAIVNGWVGDNAWTYRVGKVDEETERLLKVTEECMWAGIEAAQVGNHLGDIGYAVQSHAEAAGFGVVRELTGHGIGRDMHEDPNVFNYGKPGRGVRLEAGMVLAIEPMITAGTHKIKTLSDGWTIVTADRKNAAHFEKTIAITPSGPCILTQEA